MENIKKISSLILCGMIGLGSVVSLTGYDLINNTELIKAENVSADVIRSNGTISMDLPIYVYSVLYAGSSTSGPDNITTSAQSYSLYKKFLSASDFEKSSYVFEPSIGPVSSSVIELPGPNMVPIQTTMWTRGDTYYIISNTELTGSMSNHINKIENGRVEIKKVVLDSIAPSFLNFENKYVVDVEKNLSLDTILSNVRAYDDTDGYVDWNIVESNYVGDVIGSYNVKLRASDNAGNIANLDIIVEVADLMAPVIDGYMGVYYTNFDDPKPLTDIIKNIVVVDETDSYVDIVVEEDNYTGYERELGPHDVVLSATDDSGNKSSITITIVVTDVTNPVITGKHEYMSNMSNPITEDEIRANLSASDNVDDNLVLELVDDTYTGNEQEVGVYYVSYKVVDDSTNESELFIVYVNVYDDIKPIISGENNYTIGSTGIISSEYIISKLNSTDNVDHDLEIRLVEDNYTQYSTILGTYKMIFECFDSNGNVSDPYVVNINVIDNIPPVFWVSGDFFSVDESVTLSHQQIVEVLLRQANIDYTNVVSYSVNPTTNYSINGGNAPGVYMLSYEVKMNDGSIVSLNSQVNVLGEEEVQENDEKVQVEQRVRNLKEKIKDFFNNLWKWIVKYLGFGWLWDKENKYSPIW